MTKTQVLGMLNSSMDLFNNGLAVGDITEEIVNGKTKYFMETVERALTKIYYSFAILYKG